MNQSARVLFDDVADAAEGLLLVLEDARVTKKFYRFGPLSADQVFASGLLLQGEVDSILAKLQELDGVEIHPY